MNKTAFVLCCLLAIPAVRWFKSEPETSPYAKAVIQKSTSKLASHKDKLTVLEIPEVGENSKGDVIYRASVAVMFENPNTELVPGESVRHEIRTSRYNCARGLIAIESSIMLDEHEQIVDTQTELEVIIKADEGTTANAELNAICREADDKQDTKNIKTI